MTIKEKIMRFVKAQGNQVGSGAELGEILDEMVDSMPGPPGPQGPQGPQGNTGSSVDYPYELVNNLTTDDPEKGLSAAQGVVLKGEISQLGQQVGLPFAIDIYDFVIGSLYNGTLDISATDCVTTNSFYKLDGVDKVRITSPGYDIRVTFYRSDKTYLSNSGAYVSPREVAIPDNAYYCKISFRGSATIVLTNLIYGEFRTNLLTEIDHRYLNGEIVISTPAAKGYLNFNNTDKRIEVSDTIRFVRGRTRLVDITGNVSYGNTLKVASGIYYYLILDKSDALAIKRVTNDYSFLQVIRESVIICSFSISADDTVSEEGIIWSQIPCKIDGKNENEKNIALITDISNKQGFNLIDTFNFVLGRYGNGTYVDTSQKQSISTKYQFFFVRHINKVYVKAILSSYAYYIRCIWYDANKSYLSMTNGNLGQEFMNVPAGAFYCKFSFTYDTDAVFDATTIAGLIQGNFYTNAIPVDHQKGNNNDMRITVPIARGYIDFDNKNKKLIVKDNPILFPYKGDYVSLPVGYEVAYPTISGAPGYYRYLLFDGTDIKFMVANESNYKIYMLDMSILATFKVTKTDYIGRENIGFITFPYKIDDDIFVDLTKLELFSSHLVTEHLVESFLFFTDPHLENDAFINFENSEVMQNIVNYYKSAALAKCICGGDWINQFNNTEGQTDGDNLAAACLGNVYGFCKSSFHDFYSVIGNHEYNTYTVKPAMPKASVINLLLQEYGKSYYHIDNANSRYYIFDTGYVVTTGTSAFDYEQIAWFASKLNDNIENSVIFLHIARTDNLSSETPSYGGLVTNLTLLANAYNSRGTVVINDIEYNFASATGKVRCVIAGHRHADSSTVLNNIPVVITTHAQAGFDLCAIDYDEKKLYMTRIGSGDNREINLAD